MTWFQKVKIAFEEAFDFNWGKKKSKRKGCSKDFEVKEKGVNDEKYKNSRTSK